MKANRFFTRWKDQWVSIQNAWEHYPVPILLCVVIAALLYWSVFFEIGVWGNEAHDITKNILALTLAVPLAFSVRVFARTRGLSAQKEWILLGLSALLIAFIRFTTLSAIRNPNVLAFFTGLLAFIALALPAAWLDREATLEDNIARFVTSILVAMLYATVLMIGLFIVLGTVQFLFRLNVAKGYPYAAIFTHVLCFPVLFLGRMIPNTPTPTYPIILRQVILYIILPLTIVYTVILYIYAIQFAILGNWERSIASNLIIWYGLFCYFVAVLAKPFSETNAFTRKWIRWIPVFLIPLHLFSLMTMSMRVAQYSWTELRYLAIVVAVYSLLVQIVKSIKPQFDNKFVLAGLSLVLLFATTGPVSAGPVSERAQIGRLTNILEANQMIQDDSVVQSASLSRADQKQITDILLYLDQNHGFESVSFLPDGFSYAKMKDVFGFDYGDTGPIAYQTFRLENTPLSLNGFTYFLDGPTRSNWPITFEGHSFAYDFENQVLTVHFAEGEDYTLDFNREVHPQADAFDKAAVTREEATVSLSTASYEGEIVIREGTYDEILERWSYLDFFLLYRKK